MSRTEVFPNAAKLKRVSSSDGSSLELTRTSLKIRNSCIMTVKITPGDDVHFDNCQNVEMTLWGRNLTGCFHVSGIPETWTSQI
jgi:hypothetical protein